MVAILRATRMWRHGDRRTQMRAVAWLCSVALLWPQVAGAELLGMVQPQAATPVNVTIGKSRLLTFKAPIASASIADPGIAAVVLLSPTQVLINGKSPGITSLVAWDDQQRSQVFDVDVRADQAQLVTLIRKIAPTDRISVNTASGSIVLTGEVAKPKTISQIQELAQTFSPNVVNLLRLSEPQQIMLKVRFVEVDRTALQNIGFDAFLQGDGLKLHAPTANTIGGVGLIDTTLEDPTIHNAKTAASQIWSNGNIGGPLAKIFKPLGFSQFAYNIELLAKKNLVRVLAEPNLLAKSGEKASFLAGGEIPVPIVSNQGTSVEYKEFGIRLNFTPEITDNGGIQLKVAPEVSSLDFANGVTLNGFVIPALRSRKTETTVELGDGETFIISGLLSQETTKNLGKTPGVADVPVLGDLFKSDRFQKIETELLILVTPALVEPTGDVRTKPLEASASLTPHLRAGSAAFEDTQGDRYRSAFGAKREAVWESEAEADPFNQRKKQEGPRKAMWATEPDAQASMAGGWALNTDTGRLQAQADDGVPVDANGAISRSPLNGTYRLVEHDPRYSSDVSDFLKERMEGRSITTPPADNAPWSQFGVWQLLGVRSPSW